MRPNNTLHPTSLPPPLRRFGRAAGERDSFGGRRTGGSALSLASGHMRHFFGSTLRLPASAADPVLGALGPRPEAGTSAPTLVGSTHG
jgi:hypothetical protein